MYIINHVKKINVRKSRIKNIIVSKIKLKEFSIKFNNYLTYFLFFSNVYFVTIIDDRLKFIWP